MTDEEGGSVSRRLRDYLAAPESLGSDPLRYAQWEAVIILLNVIAIGMLLTLPVVQGAPKRALTGVVMLGALLWCVRSSVEPFGNFRAALRLGAPLSLRWLAGALVVAFGCGVLLAVAYQLLLLGHLRPIIAAHGVIAATVAGAVVILPAFWLAVTLLVRAFTPRVRSRSDR